MAKIDRYNGNLEAPASAALGTERTIFGTGSQSDDLTDQFNAFLLRGWGIVGPSDQPTLQDFNAMGFTLGQIHAYLHQVGVPEWNTLQEYHTDSFTNRNGVLYVSLVDTNTGNDPELSPAQWLRPERGIGYGQTWQDLTGSRTAGTLYTNTTGRPISVSVYSLEPAPGATRVVTLTVDGQVVSRFDRSPATGENDGHVSAIIPPGSIYSVTITGYTVGVTAFWKELR